MFLGHWLLTFNLRFRTGWLAKVWRAHGFVPSRGFPPAWTSTPLSRPSCHRSVRSKLPYYLCQWTRRLSRVKLAVILWRSMGPSTMLVFKLRTSLSAHPNLSANIKTDLIFVFREKRPIDRWQSKRDVAKFPSKLFREYFSWRYARTAAVGKRRKHVCLFLFIRLHAAEPVLSRWKLWTHW